MTEIKPLPFEITDDVLNAAIEAAKYTRLPLAPGVAITLHDHFELSSERDNAVVNLAIFAALQAAISAWNTRADQFGTSLTASEQACYRWPDDTEIHRECRKAYIAGAQDYTPFDQGDGDAVAEIVSKFGDPEAFGERELVALKDIQQFAYGTKLYARSLPAPPSKA